MKKISFLLAIVLIISLFPINVYAENEWFFVGDITASKAYMVGDVVDYSDFAINGYVTNGIMKYESDTINLFVLQYNSMIVGENQEVKIRLSIKDNYGYCDTYSHIVVKEFDKTLLSELDGKTIATSKILWKSADGFDTISYFDEITNVVTDINGNKILGNMQYDKFPTVLTLGYNGFKYKFTPFDKRFDTHYGGFSVIYKSEPKINTGKTSFSVSLHKNQYTLYVNGKSQKVMTVTKLKPNTKYKVVIKQKNYGDKKNVTVWSGTVTTKK